MIAHRTSTQLRRCLTAAMFDCQASTKFHTNSSSATPLQMSQFNEEEKSQLLKVETVASIKANRAFALAEKSMEDDAKEMAESQEKRGKSGMLGLRNFETTGKGSNARLHKVLQQPHVVSFSLFMNKLGSLQLALSSGNRSNIKVLCSEAVDLATMVSPPPEQSYDLCVTIGDLAGQMLTNGDHEFAVSLMRCAMEFSGTIPDSNKFIRVMHDLSQVMCEQRNRSAFFSSLESGVISSQFIPLAKQMINYIRERRGADESLRLKYLSGCYTHISHLYLHKKRLDTIEKFTGTSLNTSLRQQATAAV